MHSRREFLYYLIATASGLALAACKKSYIRPPGEFNLGKVQDLIDPITNIEGMGLIVFFDEQGWSVMSTRCTVDGCAASYNVDKFVCSCCRSVYTFNGIPIDGVAEKRLPFYEIKYATGMLFAEAGKDVGEKYRFTHPDLKPVLDHAKELLEAAKTGDPARVPDVLRGQSDHEIGRMFIENQPEDYFQTQKQQDMLKSRQQSSKPSAN